MQRLSGMPILTIRALRKSFGGVEVLHGVDFDAAEGEIVALLGENGAGKSTLVKTISGEYSPDSGEILLDGSAYASLTPRQTQKLGVRVISQEFQDAGPLSVAENISLGSWPIRFGLVNWSAVTKRAHAALERLGVPVDVQARVASLSVAERQIVEIARALAADARLLILDEPTAALSHAETKRLFDSLQRLRSEGVAIIYITHRLDEVEQLSDRVVVLRDGDVAASGPTSDFDRRAIVERMIGRSVGEASRPPRPDPSVAGSPVVVSMRGVSVPGRFTDVNLDAHRGEVVALYGQLGSGAEQVAESLFGVTRKASGRIAIGDRGSKPRGIRPAIAAGLGFLPADRKREGILAVRPVRENVAISSWSRLAWRSTFVTKKTEAVVFDRWRERLGVRSNDSSQPIATLSGGNQQKLVLARWLERDSQVLVLVEPTRGVDVGARAEIYQTLRRLASEGATVVAASSDCEEVYQLADRAYVMSKGSVVAHLEHDQITIERLLVAAGGQP